MAQDFWITVDGSLHNIGDITEAEQIKYYNMGIESIIGEFDKLRQQLINVGGDLATVVRENEKLRHKLGAWADVVGSYIAARDCKLLVESDRQLNTLREMVAKQAVK